MLYTCRFYFDFSASFVGLGMIIPHVVNFGLLFGGIISGAIIFPFLETKRGQWYVTESPSTLNGINGYKVPMPNSYEILFEPYYISFLS